MTTDSNYTAEGYGSKILEILESCVHYNRYIAAKMIPYLGKVNLEFGAGIGTISHYMPVREKLYLCDISEHNVTQLRSRFGGKAGIEIVHDDIAHALDTIDHDIDTIYSANVLEHIEDDAGRIAGMMAKMRPGARLAVVVPAMSSLYGPVDRLADHYRRYSKKNIREIVASLDHVQLEKCAYFNPVGAVGWFVVYKILRSRNISSGSASTMDNFIRWGFWLDYLPWPFGQSLLFVLRKQAS